MGFLKKSASPNGKSSVWLRIAIPTVVSLLLFSFVLFFVQMPAVEEAMLSQKKASLKHMTQVAISLLDHIRTQEKDGLITAEEARKKGTDILQSLRFGPDNKDYFWVMDYSPRMIMHPYRPEMNGKELTDYVDLQGKHLFREMANATETTGEGFVNYYWQWKDKPGTIAPKLSFVKKYDPWQWIIGTGLYLDDVEAEVATQNRQLIMMTIGIFGILLLLSIYSIVQSREAGKKLQESENLFKGVFNNSFQLIGVLSSEGVLLKANRTALNVVGLSEDDIIGSYCWDAPWWNYSSDVQAHMKEMVKKASHGEACRDTAIHLDTDGNTLTIDLSVKPVLGVNGKVNFIILEGRDISALKEAEKQLAISEAMFRGVFDQSLHFMGVISADGNLIEVNKAALNIISSSGAGVIGKPFWEGPWWQNSKDLIPMVKDAVKRAAEGQTIRRQAITHPSPSGFIYVDFSLHPAFGPDGKLLFLIAEGRDITELKMVQDQLKSLNEELEVKVEERTKELSDSVNRLESAQNQLIQSEKMAALGDLVAGVAHEINTPIGISVTSISYMEEKLREIVEKVKNGELRKSDLDKFIAIAVEATKSSMLNLHRAAELIGNFKQVAVDQTSGQKRKINLHEYLDEILLSLRSKYKRTQHKITITCPDDLFLDTWPGAFMQIFSNLIINSLLHGFDGVEAGNIVIRAEVNDENLVLHYSDDGNGMAEENVSKIFEPFFTTRRGSGGTGLGMNIVYSLVTSRLGGSISCTSGPGQGTAFIIKLPLNIIEV
ncbi:cache domain-containing protein [Desulfovibrio gilichinskyi]|uniref:histidine kinase n=1 Tax=Desulfovibrio gilichinskyi TaxID=1519643 RepID=A0A1X7EN73_9BACT|nr:cache domain-containing protein [Desulfovibrio gilichinskyi]SMF36873.1 PAS domain S-box-containing protein [Desulfovibrio gilichinskyi]